MLNDGSIYNGLTDGSAMRIEIQGPTGGSTTTTVDVPPGNPTFLAGGGSINSGLISSFDVQTRGGQWVSWYPLWSTEVPSGMSAVVIGSAAAPGLLIMTPVGPIRVVGLGPVPVPLFG